MGGRGRIEGKKREDRGKKEGGYKGRKIDEIVKEER